MSDEEVVSHMMRTAWSTHLLNFSTWETIFSLYPNTTITHKRMLVQSTSSVAQLKSYQQYVKRGFRRMFKHGLEHHDGNCTKYEFGELAICRSVGDEWTRRVHYSIEPECVDEYVGKQFCFTEDGVVFV